jgi:hypothetical protein
MNERNQPALPLESDEDKDLTSIAADSAHTPRPPYSPVTHCRSA